MNAPLPTNVTSPGNAPVLPDAWVERLFQKFEDFYGAKWAAQYGGFPRERVKRTWGEELGGFLSSPGVIAKAIEAQKANIFPPTLPEFLALCRTASSRENQDSTTKLLAEPPMSPEVREKMAEKLSTAVTKAPSYDYRGWAKQLRVEYLGGMVLNSAQIAAASKALGEVWENRTCKPAVELQAA